MLLNEKQVSRAYAFLSPMYDFLFDKIFYPGRTSAIKLLNIKPYDKILEVGIGTGLNLPLYPKNIPFELVGIDISEKMLKKAEEKIEEFKLKNVSLHLMDASSMEFEDNGFDHVLATYVISAVPDSVKVMREMKRVCKKDGDIVVLNHFKSENSIMGVIEETIAPFCCRLGFKTDLELEPLFKKVELTPKLKIRVNLLNGWRLVKCVNNK